MSNRIDAIQREESNIIIAATVNVIFGILFLNKIERRVDSLIHGRDIGKPLIKVGVIAAFILLTNRDAIDHVNFAVSASSKLQVRLHHTRRGNHRVRPNRFAIGAVIVVNGFKRIRIPA